MTRGPNPADSIRPEDNLASRIAYERKRHAWSYEALARRMTDLGYPIHATGLHKIEKGTTGEGSKRRRVTVDELVSFAMAFDMPVEALLSSPTEAGNRRLRELLDDTGQSVVAIRKAEVALEDRLAEMVDLCRDEAVGPARAAEIREQRLRRHREHVKAYREREAAPHDDFDAEEDRLWAAWVRIKFLDRVLAAVEDPGGPSDAERVDLAAWVAGMRPADEVTEASDE